MNTFTPRLTTPDPFLKWWHTNYAPCITGHSSTSKRLGSTLPNCFSGDTLVLTDTRVATFESLVGTQQFVFTIDKEWRKADIKCFGEQSLYTVALSNGHRYKCTANHRWIIFDSEGQPKVILTQDLKRGMKIRVTNLKCPGYHYYVTVKAITDLHKSEQVFCAVEPVTNTFTLGGGELTGNCVGYAWGRFAEIMNDYPKYLAIGNAGTWYAETTHYEKTTDPYKPRLGAVLVFTKPGKAGHVAIVEEIQTDNAGRVASITTSESGWSDRVGWDNRFWTQKRYPPNYDTNSGYVFAGFIYNPAVSGNAVGITDIADPNHPARKFVAEAESHVGAAGHAWVQAHTSIKNQAWCAAMCCAVGKACGFANVIMPSDNYNAAGFGKDVVEKYGGSYIAGPMQGNTAAIPQAGDLVIYQNKFETGKYQGHHIGIVRYCEKDIVYTVEGNTDNGQYKLKTKDRTGSGIGWYARPDWTKVGGTATVGSGSALFMNADLYDHYNDRFDASIREVCYMTSDCEPSISSTGVKLSVVNYTTILGNFVKLFGGTTGSVVGTPDNLDGLDAVPRQIVEFLTSKGLNTAAAIGIIANIRAESSFNTGAVGDYGTSFGLCQWHLGRGTAMKQTAGSDWAHNLSGQLKYLWIELNQPGYARLLNTLKEVPNTLEGAKRATDAFVRIFEVPSDVDNKTIKRQSYAEEFWNQIVVVNNNTGSTGIAAAAQSGIATQSGQKVTTGNSVAVPSTVSQTGIIANYTSYTAFYGKWTRGTTQRRLSEIWGEQGKPHSHNIATISGYYLIALKPVFGSVGDIVSVVLEDNTYFNAIIADEKGSDSPSRWGHPFGSQIDIVEWESYGSNQSDLRAGIKEAGWLNKKVDRIVNYGSWLR